MNRPFMTMRGGQIEVREATGTGYAIAEEGDSINLEQPNSLTRRARVGKGIANTLTTSCNQAVVVRESTWTQKDVSRSLAFVEESGNET